MVFDNLPPLMIGAAVVTKKIADPREGNGWPESVVLFALLGTVIYETVMKQSHDPVILGMAGTALIAFFGDKWKRGYASA